MTPAILALLLASPSPADAPKPMAFDRFLVVPLRVHVLADPDLDLANCKIKDDAVRRSIANINKIWAVAGIHFSLESIAREPAARKERFKTIVELNDGQADASTFALLLPTKGREFDGLHAFIFRELGMNGAYLGEDNIVSIEQPQLRQVAGGSDDPLARVIARGLGQALGLPGQPSPTALLASGTNGQVLTGAEVDRARTVARTVSGASPVADLRKSAELADSRGDKAHARLLWAWLSEIPGAPADARKRAAAPGPKP